MKREKLSSKSKKVNPDNLPIKDLPGIIKNLQKNNLESKQPEEFTQSLYLYGAIAQAPLTNLIRGNCIKEENENLEKTLSSWKKATEVFRNIEVTEKGIANNNIPIDLEHHPKLDEIKRDPLFKNTFSVNPIEFKYVEIDHLVAPQRNVSLPYVDILTKKISDKPTLEELIDLCISPNQEVPIPKALQNAQNSYTFTSPSADFRFVGGYLKENLSEKDLEYSFGGGLPISAIMLFVGYGGGSINVLKTNNRLILNNGFHRVYALRKKGITKIPVVVQNIGNPNLDMPASILGLDRGYLLGHPRPVLVKDFFNNELTTVLKLKKTVTTVKVQWGVEKSGMAV